MNKFTKILIINVLFGLIIGVSALIAGYKLSALDADIDPAIVFLVVSLVSCGFGVYKIVADRTWSFVVGLIAGLLLSLVVTSLLLWGA